MIKHLIKIIILSLKINNLDNPMQTEKITDPRENVDNALIVGILHPKTYPQLPCQWQRLESSKQMHTCTEGQEGTEKDKLQISQNSISQGNLVVLLIVYFFQKKKKSDVC